jgi:hypothetical protein
MTMLPLSGTLTSAAGAPLSQTAGAETERAQKDAIAQRRTTDADQHAEKSAGIGQTEQDQETSERDADGRRLWERPAGKDKNPATDSAINPTTEGEAQLRQSKDPSGQSGTQLDLTG